MGKSVVPKIGLSNPYLHFKTNVQLKSIIGKDLINDDNIAILELVKNSFDADAKRVDIEFVNLKNNDDNTLKKQLHFTANTSRLIILDDGVGMGLTEIEDRWLNIAYSEKKTNATQHNRLMAGAKGVGRFSCDRLGEYLNLYAKKSSSEDYVNLFVDWKAFEIENDKDKEIQSIPIQYQILTKDDLTKVGLKPIKHGVILEIIKLRSKWVYSKAEESIVWDTSKLSDLKKYLEKLINPNQAFVENDFGIYLDAKEFKIENDELEDSERFIGKVENRIFEKLDFKSTSIESEIIDNGKVIYTELKDRKRTIFWIKEKNKYDLNITNAKVVLYYLNPYTKAFFTKQTGIRAVDYGSVFLFVNGFRVPPYGEQGNDWLLLDQRKGQGYARFLGSREVVGRIEILDKGNNFQIISSREGIVRNDSYKTLTRPNDGYFYKTFRRLEKYVVEGLNWDSIPIEDRNRMSEIEKKIISGETDESDLAYSEDDVIKSRRVYSAIHSIISADPEDVIELYINEEIISDKIAEQREQSAKELEQLLIDFENKNIDPHIIEQLLLRRAKENKDLEKQLKEFSKYTTNELTSKALLEIEDYRRTIDDQRKIIFQLKTRLEAAEEKASQATTSVAQIQEELKEAQSQNLFLKSLKSQELDEVVSFMHSIGISASMIDNYLSSTYQRINRNLEIDKIELNKIIETISFEVRKILSITRFATKANFKLYTESASVDLIEFISEYLINIVSPLRGENLKISIKNKTASTFVKYIKPIEISILLDNFVSNSIRANSTIFEVTFESIDEKLCLSIQDNGVGIKNELVDKIFDFGFTTTTGSGLGLFHVKQILVNMNAKISVNNKSKLGTEFKIYF